MSAVSRLDYSFAASPAVASATAARDAALGALTGAVEAFKERVDRYLTDKPIQSILLVEDQEYVAALVLAALRQAGFEVEVARTISEARRLLKRRLYGVALLDMYLPDGDGWTLAEQLPHSIAVVLMSAVADSAALPDLMARTRAQAILESPPTATQLIDLMTNLLKPRRITQPLAVVDGS
jgi:DNA-binding NtrC family response regulator